jgi:leader peptidase (prepilin peptidase)/N-methyltransferase
VEALTAALFVFLAYRLVVAPGRLGDPDAWALLVVSAAFVSALVASSFIDLEHRIIPDRITKPGMVLAPLASLVAPELHQVRWLSEISPRPAALLLSLAGIAAGAGSIWFMGFLGKAIFRKEAMGLGDVKFMGLVGGVLGPLGVLLAILLACIVGSVIGGLRLLVTRKHYIPFGPYLSLGSVLVLFFRPEILHFVQHDYPRFVRGLLGDG